MTDLLKCSECGTIFAEEDLIVEEEYRDEAYGSPCYEKMTYSPCCHGDYTEQVEDSSQMWFCKCCGKVYTNDDIDIEYERVEGYKWEAMRTCPECLDAVEEYVEV